MITSTTLRKMIPMCSKTLYNRIAAGTLPAPTKIGRFNYWHEKEILAVKNGNWQPNLSIGCQDSQPTPA